MVLCHAHIFQRRNCVLDCPRNFTSRTTPLYLTFVLGCTIVRAVRPCGICGGQSGTRAGFLLSTSVSRASSHSTKWSILIDPGLVQ
jgi:hypothetical protein